MKLSEYFNIYDVRHIKAWLHLVNTGMLPLWFWDEMKQHKVVADNMWQVSVSARMAQAWANHVWNELGDLIDDNY